jgi:hydroxypyruvate reductase
MGPRYAPRIRLRYGDAVRGPTHRLLLDLFAAAVAAVQPGPAVAAALAARRDQRFRAVGATGKAAPGMMRAAQAALGDLPSLVVSDHAEPVPDGCRLLVAAHPVPDRRSLDAGEALLDLCAGLGDGDRLLYLLSGGSSSLVEALRPGVTLGDLAATTEVLLERGVPIVEMNAVRTAISRLKGGGVARAAAPAAVTTIAISDVPGGAPHAIGSGPTLPPATIDPRIVVRTHRLVDHLPPAVLAAVAEWEPPPATPHGDFEIVADGALAAAAAAAAARRRGLHAVVAEDAIGGEARATAPEVIHRFRAAPDVDVLVLHGETTVTVTGSGHGGRNQEAALAAAIVLDGSRDVTFLAAGTDGIDGRTDAAGGIVDGTSVGAGSGDPFAALAANDSGPWLEAAGARIVTGPTGTNVGDLWILARTETRAGPG